MRWLISILALSAALVRADDTLDRLTISIALPSSPARLVEVTATAKVTNESATDVSKYIFRITTPPGDLPYQRSRVVVSPSGATSKSHKNKLDQYLEMNVAVPAKQTVNAVVQIQVLLLPVNFLKLPKLPVEEVSQDSVRLFEQPSTLVESDAAEIKQVATTLFARKTSALEKAKAAYEYPASKLKYREQKAAGALKALQTGSGDCTEFACLFAALSRAGGLPARRVAVFNLGTKTSLTTDEPNHESAEVFLATHGWIPVDPNLGGGRYDRSVGFAKTAAAQVMLRREGAWVWSTLLPADGFASDKPKPSVKTSVSWQCKVLQEGPPVKLLASFNKSEP